ncbi:glycosyltransferase family 4 protein [Candidatus Saccharibacteria bacterium]|nr:glycosyltransferase family 4 protein [Candidatus Saccharibacteria bacterium]
MNKVVFLVRNVSPEKYGGGETYQLMLAEGLRGHGFKPYIVTSSLGLLREARKNGLDAIRAPYINQQNWSGWRNILFPIYCIKILKLRKWYKQVFEEYKPSTVNIQSRDDWVAATKMAKKKHIQVLWTDHMDFRSWVLTNVNVKYKNWIGKWVLYCAKKADRIIMISDYERECFERIVGHRKYNNVITIKNGVRDSYNKYNGVKKIKDSVCYVGRIVDYKGIGELITAFSEVCREYPDAKLNIYGDGNDYDKYRKMVVSDKRIIFHGRTNKPLEAIAENEIFVLPSYREGLSLSLLDAAMMKKKIIASDVDGNPEIVVGGETGLLVPARNKNELSKAIIWMLAHKKEAERMARNARKHYEKNFCFESIFEEKILPLYNNTKEE